MYEVTRNYFYKSLSLSLKQRKKESKKKNREIFPADEIENGLKIPKEFVVKQQNSRNKRVSRILNNNRPESYPYLMSSNEVDVLTKTLNYTNSDEMLWGHIRWQDMYSAVIEDLSKGNVSNDLQETFKKNLIDYVPYSKLHYYEVTEYGKVWGLYEKQEKEDITNKAIKWSYFDSTETYVKELKKSFLKEFTGTKLDKFNQKLSYFLDKFLKEFLQQFIPEENSFGQQTFRYQKEVDINYDKLNGIKEQLHGGENDITTLLDEYTTYSINHIEKLAMFQKKFKELENKK
ncbi:hypothetical protein ACWN8B_05735 [Vagococcus zengguangii]|uniref:Uncharacterized protein n=1 Tax=Vagococcus zengguangii TaxID=2571750 RepID=A0A4D7CS10_9ENTE|nr:hypothetical protein [Vagococcus zengguangii]QCI86899.1 hypothetical protein FA707_07925 [Vagococcus zengguangii]